MKNTQNFTKFYNQQENKSNNEKIVSKGNSTAFGSKNNEADISINELKGKTIDSCFSFLSDNMYLNSQKSKIKSDNDLKSEGKDKMGAFAFEGPLFQSDPFNFEPNLPKSKIFHF